MNHRIFLDDNFEIEYDGARCYTLIQKKKITGEGRGSHLVKAGSIGKTRETEMGYHGTLKGALAAYVDKTVGMTSVDLTSVINEMKKCEEIIKRVAELPKTTSIISD